MGWVSHLHISSTRWLGPECLHLLFFSPFLVVFCWRKKKDTSPPGGTWHAKSPRRGLDAFTRRFRLVWWRDGRLASSEATWRLIAPCNRLKMRDGGEEFEIGGNEIFVCFFFFAGEKKNWIKTRLSDDTVTWLGRLAVRDESGMNKSIRSIKVSRCLIYSFIWARNGPVEQNDMQMSWLCLSCSVKVMHFLAN